MTGDGPARPIGAGWASWRLHLFAVVAVAGCLVAGYVELRRALAGNGLSWVYAGEWPLFAGLGVHVWASLVRERRGDREGGRTARTTVLVGDRSRLRSDGSDCGDGSDAVTAAPTDDGDDLQLRAWRSYLADLHAQDPPGGPPW